MYSVQPRLANLYSSNDSLNDLLDSIDDRILIMAICKYNYIQLDLACDCNMDAYDDLTTYRKILLDKLLGCNCLNNQRLIKMATRIKRLLR